MEKPDVDSIEGLSPAISIDQKTTSKNPRSTVGTVTEIYDYLRLLWARIGTPHCPKCGKEIRQQTIDQIIDQLMNMGEGTRCRSWPRWCEPAKGEHQKIFEDAQRSGFVRVRVDGNLYDFLEGDQAGKEQKAQHRNCGGPDRSERRGSAPAHRLGGNGRQPVRGPGDRPGSRRQRNPVFPELRL